MSVRSSVFYGSADGNHWHLWENAMRRDDGVFLDVDLEFGKPDNWGYQDLEIEAWDDGARIQMRIPRSVCEAIGEWYALRKAQR